MGRAQRYNVRHSSFPVAPAGWQAATATQVGGVLGPELSTLADKGSPISAYSLFPRSVLPPLAPPPNEVSSSLYGILPRSVLLPPLIASFLAFSFWILSGFRIVFYGFSPISQLSFSKFLVDPFFFGIISDFFSKKIPGSANRSGDKARIFALNVNWRWKFRRYF